MALELPEWQIRAYAANVMHLAQEISNKVTGTTRSEARAAERIGFDRLAPMEGETPVVRLAPTPNAVADHSRRWVFPKAWVFAHQTDNIEKLKQIHDPTNEYAFAGAAAYNRELTRRFLAAARGAASEGEGTPITVALPAGQKIAHGSVRLTSTKIIEARTTLDTATGGETELMGPLYFLYHPDDLRTLLKDPLFSSMDYVTRRSLMEGRPPIGWMGFNWISTSLLPVVAGIRFNVAWAKLGMAFGENTAGRETDIGVRLDLSLARQIFMQASYDFVRSDDRFVVEVGVDTAAAA